MPRKPPYTEAEVAALRQLFPTAPAAEVLAALPRRNWATIARKASSLHLRRKHRMPTEWSAADVQLLREHYPSGGAVAVLPLLSRKANRLAIQKKAAKMGIAVGRLRYTDQERELIRTLYPCAPVAELLAALPGRSMKALGTEAQSMGLARRAIVWQAADVEYLRTNYPALGPAAVGKHLGYSTRQCISKAFGLGVVYRKPAPVKVAKVIKPPKPVTVKPAATKATKAPATAVHDPRPKAKNTLRPMHIIGAATKSDPRTPVLNAAKAARLRGERAAKAESVSDQLKKLAYDHPARMAYMLNAKHGGPAAQAAFYAALQQAA